MMLNAPHKLEISAFSQHFAQIAVTTANLTDSHRPRMFPFPPVVKLAALTLNFVVMNLYKTARTLYIASKRSGNSDPVGRRVPDDRKKHMGPDQGGALLAVGRARDLR